MNSRYKFLMPIVFHLLSLFLASSFAYAKEYGNYDLKRILTVSESPAGKKYGIDVNYLDQILNDLAFHAKNYPPKFDTSYDQQRATKDVKTLSGMLDTLVKGPSPNTDILLRAGFLNSIGHNLDIPGSAKKADIIFQKLLTVAPSDPRGNYMYGTFLSGAGKPKEALPYLEKALSVGVVDASYALGMTYLSLGDKQKALENLEAYRQRKPNDKNVTKLIEAIRNGKVEIKKSMN
jgi:predicted Zn-dependent protease